LKRDADGYTGVQQLEEVILAAICMSLQFAGASGSLFAFSVTYIFFTIFEMT
jgi:hypothetical protein